MPINRFVLMVLLMSLAGCAQEPPRRPFLYDHERVMLQYTKWTSDQERADWIRARSACNADRSLPCPPDPPGMPAIVGDRPNSTPQVDSITIDGKRHSCHMVGTGVVCP